MKRILVAGAGLMGHGIAQIHALAGFDVVLYEPDLRIAEKAIERIRASLGRSVERGRLDRTKADRAVALIHPSGALKQAALGADLVIEAIYEDLSAKCALFGELDGIAATRSVFVTNTSSLSVDALAAAVGTRRRVQFAGLHFFSPVQAMPLVEIVRGSATSQSTVDMLREHTAALGKQALLCADRPGFVVNRLLLPFLAEAMRAYEEGLATAADIDAGARLGLGHRMGPLELADFIGLDVLAKAMTAVYEGLGSAQFKPPAVLLRLVAAGHLGQKTGRGLYDDARSPTPVDR